MIPSLPSAKASKTCPKLAPATNAVYAALTKEPISLKSDSCNFFRANSAASVVPTLANAATRAWRKPSKSTTGTSSNSSVIFGYMLLPTARSLRVAKFLKRLCKIASTASCVSPDTNVSKMPPLPSKSWNNAQDFSVNSSVNGSKYQLPPAGSTG